MDRAAKLAELEALENALADAESLKLERARNDFATFCETVMRDEKTHELIQLSDIHKMWIQHIGTCWGRALIPFILAPYGSGKTSIIAVALSLYMIGRDPDIRIMLVSANDEIAMDRLALVRNYIEESEEYHRVFPNIKPGKKWGTTKIYIDRGKGLAKDATLRAVGATSSAIGSRADLIILDDLNDQRNTLTYPKLRKSVWKTYTSALLSRVEGGGKLVAIATRWHTEDIFGLIGRDPRMSSQYGFLIQAINEDMTGLDCEIVLGDGSGATKIKNPDEIKRMRAFENCMELYDAGLLREDHGEVSK